MYLLFSVTLVITLYRTSIETTEMCSSLKYYSTTVSSHFLCTSIVQYKHKGPRRLVFFSCNTIEQLSCSINSNTKNCLSNTKIAWANCEVRAFFPEISSSPKVIGRSLIGRVVVVEMYGNCTKKFDDSWMS